MNIINKVINKQIFCSSGFFTLVRVCRSAIMQPGNCLCTVC